MSGTNTISERNYLKWMYDLVCKNRYSKEISFKKLFIYLRDTEFTYSIRMDSNRAKDGIELRRRYENEFKIANLCDHLRGPCSILEMMIALSIRCEETIMDDENFGDRTDQWFWEMIKNLGLGDMNDDEFDENYVSDVIARFLNRDYKSNGQGGLFTVKNCDIDLRNVEIWIQMLWYLDNIT